MVGNVMLDESFDVLLPVRLGIGKPIGPQFFQGLFVQGFAGNDSPLFQDLHKGAVNLPNQVRILIDSPV
jgi:hypothetical protein